MTEARRWRSDCKYRVFSEHLNCTVNPVGGCKECQDFAPRTFSEEIMAEEFDRCAEAIGDHLPTQPRIGQTAMITDWDGVVRPFIFNGLQWQPRLTRSQRILRFLHARWQVFWRVWSFAAAIAVPLIAIGHDWDRALFYGLHVYLFWMFFCFYEDRERVESFLWDSEYRGKFFTVLFGVLLLLLFRSF